MSQADISEVRKLFVGNLPPGSTSEDVRSYFEARTGLRERWMRAALCMHACMHPTDMHASRILSAYRTVACVRPPISPFPPPASPQRFGELEEIYMPQGPGKDFSFVTFREHAQAKAVLLQSETEGHSINGHKVSVKLPTEKKPSYAQKGMMGGPSGFGGPGGGRGFGGRGGGGDWGGGGGGYGYGGGRDGGMRGDGFGGGYPGCAMGPVGCPNPRARLALSAALMPLRLLLRALLTCSARGHGKRPHCESGKWFPSLFGALS